MSPARKRRCSFERLEGHVCNVPLGVLSCLSLPAPMSRQLERRKSKAKYKALAVGWEWCSVDLCLGRTIRRGHPDPSPDPTEYGGAAGQRAEGPNSLLCRAAGVSISWSCWKVRMCVGLQRVPWEAPWHPGPWQKSLLTKCYISKTWRDSMRWSPSFVSAIPFTGPNAKQIAWHCCHTCIQALL